MTPLSESQTLLKHQQGRFFGSVSARVVLMA